MTHMQHWAVPWGYCGGPANSYEVREMVHAAAAEAAISAARADMLAKCITAVEWSHDHNAEHAQGLWLALTELRALQEKP